MNGIDVRPRVANLVFHLYDRPLHPELFDPVCSRVVAKRDFLLSVHITPAGHVVSWQGAAGHVTEVAATADLPLPDYRACLFHRIRGERTATYIANPGLRYQCSFQVETVSDDVFAHVHQEILSDGLKRGLLHNFRPGHRLALAPLGYVTTESWEGNVVVSTIHTFPGERTFVKTQSLIERTR